MRSTDRASLTNTQATPNQTHAEFDAICWPCFTLVSYLLDDLWLTSRMSATIPEIPGELVHILLQIREIREGETGHLGVLLCRRIGEGVVETWALVLCLKK